MKRRISFLGIILALFCICMPLRVYAYGTLTIEGTQKDIVAIQNTFNTINENCWLFIQKPNIKGLSEAETEMQREDIVELSEPHSGSKGFTIDLTFNNSLYYGSFTEEEQERCLKIILNNVRNSSISQVTRNKLISYVSDADKRKSGLIRELNDDVGIDLPNAYAWFRPFTGVIGTLLGVFTLVLFALLGVGTTTDIAFLTIPGVQWFLIRESTEREKPRFISLEAWESYKVAEQTHDNILGIYFARRAKIFMAMGICILYLASGKLFILVAKIVDYLQTVFAEVFA